MVKVLIVVGTRPEVIKMAPVVRALSEHSSRISFKVCTTSQHREMAADALRIFNIHPDYDLDVMTEDQSPARVAASVLERTEVIFKSDKPDWLLVQGDTTTVSAASLAAFYSGVRVGHVEAGLRTHDRYRPFPEEVHRRIVTILADLHFAPTVGARAELLKEGIPEKDIALTGNPVVDAVHWVAAMPFDQERLPIGPRRSPQPRILLVTAHRRESFGAPLENICKALREIGEHYGDKVLIIYPVHMNPNVHGPVHRILAGIPNVLLTPALDYLTFIHILKRSYLVLTDSGGVQEEAPTFGIPIIVLRDVTERPENIQAGIGKIVGSDRNRIVNAVRQLLDGPEEYSSMSGVPNPFGDGHAASRIVNALLARAENTRA
jgi:UDP-N-acetylglucosamine 2-epimerase (non-hydrolysing)